MLQPPHAAASRYSQVVAENFPRGKEKLKTRLDTAREQAFSFRKMKCLHFRKVFLRSDCRVATYRTVIGGGAARRGAEWRKGE